MWWGRSRTGDIYLSGRTLAVRADGEVRVEPITDEDWRVRLAAAFAEQPKWRWRVWLGGSRCALHAVDPMTGLRGIEEAEIALGASLSAGEAAAEARLATWPQPKDSPWIVGTTPAGLVRDLAAMAESADASLASIRPWWSAHAVPKGEGAAFCDAESISYWRVDANGRIGAAATLSVSEPSTTQTLRRLRAGGALGAWRLDVHLAHAKTGFVSAAMEEEAHGATPAAV